ncbi:Voltage-dependent N-type calcium channel subunit alpha-1B [Cichlidogyrus casuarinus]|uniref:Voltage-dependent N-type calcium channel subunit alpha-1B n=1 Tax=Cichlidogyrus casuarinus TaxID=1844966 RepID=A0ABD2Q7V7_9PLAT
MLRKLEPPVGFGKKCPSRLAYRKLIRMNMPVDENGKVHFTTTLFALIRESLSIKMGPAELMDIKDAELRESIKVMWPLQAKKCLDLLIPPDSELTHERMTVGKIYAGKLILEAWQSYKSSLEKGEQPERSRNAMRNQHIDVNTLREEIVRQLRRRLFPQTDSFSSLPRHTTLLFDQLICLSLVQGSEISIPEDGSEESVNNMQRKTKSSTNCNDQKNGKSTFSMTHHHLKNASSLLQLVGLPVKSKYQRNTTSTSPLALVEATRTDPVRLNAHERTEFGPTFVESPIGQDRRVSRFHEVPPRQPGDFDTPEIIFHPVPPPTTRKDFYDDEDTEGDLAYAMPCVNQRPGQSRKPTLYTTPPPTGQQEMYYSGADQNNMDFASAVTTLVDQVNQLVERSRLERYLGE